MDGIKALNKMEDDLISKRMILTRVKEVLIYKKDKELVNVARNNIHKTIGKIREINKIFKNREDSIKSRMI